ncbi:MAG: GreA/GreB family elongation factor [Candidatus Dormibacteria bacterium]
MARDGEKPIPMTATGLEALKSELTDLRERRPSMVDRVATARSDGDLKENFAYHDARQDLGMLDGRVQTIEGILANVMVIEEVATDGIVALGSKVVVKDEFGESTYSLVGPAEADVAKGMISHESPLGTALIGRGVGDKVTFATPGGERSAEIVRVD